ncbi:MAG TPA: DinB family protein [Terriglobia bacterium]|nr:DinB family protein [Terriglobia bacterium]
MIRTIKDFEGIWTEESDRTCKIFRQLNDLSLSRSGEPEGRTLGRMAWHITLSIPEMMSQTGLSFSVGIAESPVPTSTDVIRGTYALLSNELLVELRTHWTDQTLEICDEMYGQHWKRGYTLTALIFHQIHHRGQMTLLMRQAGLTVPGLFGPAREEWSSMGMPSPAI